MSYFKLVPTRASTFPNLGFFIESIVLEVLENVNPDGTKSIYGKFSKGCKINIGMNFERKVVLGGTRSNGRILLIYELKSYLKLLVTHP